MEGRQGQRPADGDAMKVGLIISALDETWSVRETIETALRDDDGRIVDILMATAPYSTPECRKVVAEMMAERPGLVREHVQSQLKGVGGAMRECIPIVKGDWVVIMSSDLETPPDRLKDIIDRAEKGDVDIVATSRWLPGGDFGNYSRVKLVCNWIFQRSFSLLYLCRLTDMTYGYRAYRREVLERYSWSETGLAFFLESLVKPLRDGMKVVEVPVSWRRRQEGKSHMVLSEYARYFRTGLKVRFARRRSFLADGGGAEAGT